MQKQVKNDVNLVIVSLQDFEEKEYQEFLNQNDSLREINEIKNDKEKTKILVELPFIPNIPIFYQNHSVFKNLLEPENQKIRQKHSYEGYVTSTALENLDGQVVAFSSQNVGLHKDIQNGLCLRTRLRNLGKIATGQGYDLCLGCNHDNHSEILAISQAKKEGRYDLLKGGRAYLYGHWWSCQNCSGKLEAIGIKEIIIYKNWVRERIG